MPPGGRREGAGRPKGVPNKRHQVTAKQIGYDEYTPIEYMLALMRDERTEATRRDQMAIQAAPFIHARLSAVSTSNVPGRDGGGGGDLNITQIFAVPRGSRIDKSGAVLTIDGTAVELQPIEPHAGTPPLLTDESAPAPIAEPLPVHEIDTTNVTVLRRRSDDDPDSAA
jgi:hypothetical protein